MTDQEIKLALERLGLQVPQKEREDIALAAKYILEMADSVKKPRSIKTEPAHLVIFSKE